MSLIANIDDIIASFNQNRDELKNFGQIMKNSMTLSNLKLLNLGNNFM